MSGGPGASLAQWSRPGLVFWAEAVNIRRCRLLMPGGRPMTRRLRVSVPEGRPIVAWHEMPGTAPPQKNRPVGHGMTGPGPNLRANSRRKVPTSFPQLTLTTDKCLLLIADRCSHFID
jgi:hypothetical protein